MRLLAGLILALLAVPALGGPRAEPSIDQAALLRHISWLADDAQEGRAPGTDAGSRTAQYIATEFQRAGLTPGALGGNWYQPVPLILRRPVSTQATWRHGEPAFEIDPDEILMIARDAAGATVHAPLLFVGYGADADKVAAAGKVVLILPGHPDGVASFPPFDERRAGFVRAGAAAVLIVAGAGDPWSLIRAQLARSRFVPSERPVAPVEGAISYAAWQQLLAAAKMDPAELAQAAGEAGFSAREVAITLDLSARAEVREIEPVNVMAKIVGRDADAGAVLMLAHWDHLGICRPEGAPDRICNGAVDNASGVAVLIEIGRRLAAGPRPRRTIYVIATTAEESGLLGAAALVRDPPVPLQRIVAVLNLDTVAIAPAGEPVAVIGRGRTRLDPIIDRAIAIQRRKLDASDAANAFIERQDGWMFSKAGVPAVMVGGAFSNTVRLTSFLAGDYHSPIDDVAHLFPLDGAAEDAALHVVLARLLADPAIFPATP